MGYVVWYLPLFTLGYWYQRRGFQRKEIRGSATLLMGVLTVAALITLVVPLGIGMVIRRAPLLAFVMLGVLLPRCANVVG